MKRSPKPLSTKPLIAIPAWHFEDISGTGKLQRVFLKHLHLIRGISFVICFPCSQKDFLKKTIATQRKEWLKNEINLVFLDKIPRESCPKWLKRAYGVFEERKVNLIFYFNPDVYHLATIPFVSIIHDVMTITLKEYALNPFKKWAERRKLEQSERAVKIITVSHFSKAGIVEHLKIPPEKITVIYNGIEENRSSPLESSKNPSKNLREKYILYVGDLRRRKNVFKLVLAYLRLEERFLQEYKLYLTGSGKLVDKIKKIAKKKKRLDNIIFWQQVSQEKLNSLYQGASLFVFPSLEEGFGLPIIEAQQSKLPVICGRHSSLLEITAGSVLYAKINSVGDLKNKITNLLSDKRLRRKIAEKGYKNSLRFTPEKMIFEYENLFKQILVGS